MDNLTHSAIGLIVGETVVRVLKKPGLRTPVLLASVMGNNIPDLDVLYTAITEAPYGNLLHHRGHTHTFAFAIPLAGLIVAVVRWWQKKKATESGLLFGVAAFGVCTHIIADWWNSYGVHPFWPADNHWYSGDMIFIIEPWLWLVMGPFLFSAAQGRIQKVFAGLLLVPVKQ